MKDKRDNVLYIGKAKSLRDRVSSYFLNKDLLPRTALLVKEIDHIDHILVESEIDALILEANLVRKFQPHFNVDLKDGKAYPLIEITIKDKVPMVNMARKETNPKAIYFGPYPTGADITGLLRFLRPLFPYVNKRHIRNHACLRSHLGLCPCPDVFTDKEALAKYRKTLRNLIGFLKGERELVQKQLAKEMLEESKKQNYEKAGEIKKKLEQIALVTQKRTKGFEYEVNPNLYTDRTIEEVNELGSLLNIKGLKKIECYDISNTSGKNATAAQVTFVNGLPEKRLYRRYKIKLKDTPDDFAMLAETISRRIKSEIPLPELFVIDGGKGQLSTIVKLLKDKPTRVIGLAKRLETIFTDRGEEINLPLTSPALKLLQKMRDEAHRFSRKYHFLLRRKAMLS